MNLRCLDIVALSFKKMIRAERMHRVVYMLFSSLFTSEVVLTWKQEEFPLKISISDSVYTAYLIFARKCVQSAKIGKRHVSFPNPSR